MKGMGVGKFADNRVGIGGIPNVEIDIDTRAVNFLIINFITDSASKGFSKLD